MGTNCTLSLPIFSYTPVRLRLYKILSKTKKKNESKSFNLTFRYIDDVLSVNNQSFANGIPLIYLKEFELKEKQKQLSLPHFLTFTSYLTQML
jgi:hypothetical protein